MYYKLHGFMEFLIYPAILMMENNVRWVSETSEVALFKSKIKTWKSSSFKILEKFIVLS